MIRRLFAATVIVATAGLFSACETTPSTAGQRLDLKDDARSTRASMLREDPTLQQYFDDAHGYVIFPNVGRGAFIAGGSFGRGVVHEQGQMIGFADMTQATIGAQAGGQSISQIIFFEYEEAMRHFKTGNWALAANATAVIVTSGAGASADYDRGVAVFVLPRGGAMVEASVGGQRFRFEPL